MAKKKRKSSKRKAKPTVAVSTSSAEVQAVSKSRRGISNEEFNPDYTLIIRDLKRIGMLAATFFVVLVALSFFL